MTLTTTELDLAVAPTPAPFTTVEALLATFDANVASSRAALAKAADADFAVPWSLKSGDQVYLHAARAP